jgi:hypothetical protein
MMKRCGVAGDIEKVSDLFRGDTCPSFTAFRVVAILDEIAKIFSWSCLEMWVACKIMVGRIAMFSD